MRGHYDQFKTLTHALKLKNVSFIKNGIFFDYFCLFKQTLQFLQQIYVNKYPSSIQCGDLNPRPLEHESPPITNRPGLPPKSVELFDSE